MTFRLWRCFLERLHFQCGLLHSSLARLGKVKSEGIGQNCLLFDFRPDQMIQSQTSFYPNYIHQSCYKYKRKSIQLKNDSRVFS